jgi:hypothetical protein
MAKKDKRSTAEQIKHLERSIAKFGDSDGTRTAALDKLRGDKKTK